MLKFDKKKILVGQSGQERINVLSWLNLVIRSLDLVRLDIVLDASGYYRNSTEIL